MATTIPLQVRRRPRARLAGWSAAIAAFGGVVLWYANTPQELPTSATPVLASTPVGRPVYVGVFNPPADLGRELHLSGVKVSVTSAAPVEVTPLLCVRGAFAATAEPASFCDDLVDPDGRTLTDADTVVLRVTGEQPTAVDIERVRLGLRDGLRWGTLPAGAPAQVELLGR